MTDDSLSHDLMIKIIQNALNHTTALMLFKKCIPSQHQVNARSICLCDIDMDYLKEHSINLIPIVEWFKKYIFVSLGLDIFEWQLTGDDLIIQEALQYIVKVSLPN